MNQDVIEVKNLSKEFRKRPVLRNITMSIPCNCVYGLLGANGAGKIRGGFLEYKNCSDGTGAEVGLWLKTENL